MKASLALLIIIIVIVIAIASGAYYIGVRHALAPTISTSTPATSTSTNSGGTPPPSSSYYTNVAAWQTYSNSQADFSIAYPLDFPVDTNNTMTPTSDWRVNSTDPGVKVVSITVPSAFEPQTNFSNATLTVGYSQNSQAVADCLSQSPNGPPAATSTAVINGITFTVFSSSDVGAGNIYKTTSYRTLHAGECYAVEYTVHSAELGNYPPSYGLTQYSDTTIDAVLNRVVGTFKFL